MRLIYTTVKMWTLSDNWQYNTKGKGWTFSYEFHGQIQLETGLVVTFAFLVVCKNFCKKMNKETELDIMASLGANKYLEIMTLVQEVEHQGYIGTTINSIFRVYPHKLLCVLGLPVGYRSVWGFCSGWFLPLWLQWRTYYTPYRRNLSLGARTPYLWTRTCKLAAVDHLNLQKLM